MQKVLSEIDCALLSAVGEGLGSCPDLLPNFLASLNDVGIAPLFVGGSALSLTAVVEEKYKELGVRSLHQSLVESRGAPELAHHDHEGLVEQAAEVEVFHERGERGVRGGEEVATGQFEMVAVRVVPLSPLAVVVSYPVHVDKADASFTSI